MILWALSAVAFGACTMPSENDVIGGLPCDDEGRCAEGYVCDVTLHCVRPGELGTGGATGSETGGAAGLASGGASGSPASGGRSAGGGTSSSGGEEGDAGPFVPDAGPDTGTRLDAGTDSSLDGSTDGPDTSVSSCDDLARNGAETDVDCGGPSCDRCADGKRCKRAEDCESSVCKARVCAVPACDDGFKNGNETDRDCGGDCAKCAPGQACIVNADCENDSCTAVSGLGSICSS